MKSSGIADGAEVSSASLHSAKSLPASDEADQDDNDVKLGVDEDALDDDDTDTDRVSTPAPGTYSEASSN